jgi:antitoxin HicB
MDDRSDWRIEAGHFPRDAEATRHPQGRVLNMQTWIFPAVIEKLGDDDFLATFPDVPEAMTGGASLTEVRENAADALEEAILAYLAHGRPIPSTAMRAKKISNVALAKTLGKTEGAIRRLTDGSSAVKIDTVLQAMNALGARAILAVLESE